MVQPLSSQALTQMLLPAVSVVVVVVDSEEREAFLQVDSISRIWGKCLAVVVVPVALRPIYLNNSLEHLVVREALGPAVPLEALTLKLA